MYIIRYHCTLPTKQCIVNIIRNKSNCKYMIITGLSANTYIYIYIYILLETKCISTTIVVEL